AGIMNIGMDGMILMGALIGVLGSYVIGSAAGGVAVAVLFGILVGLFFALFVVKLKSDEFIIGCALNIFASGFTAYVSRAVFGLSGTSGYEIDYMRPIEIPVIKDIPFLGEIISGNTALVYVAWVLILVMWLFVYKTPYGFWMRASGEKPETLRTAGISPEKMKWLSSVLCGILCGLSGAYLSLGYLNGTFVEGMSASRGFIALLRHLRRRQPGQGLSGRADVRLLRRHRSETAKLHQLRPHIRHPLRHHRHHDGLRRDQQGAQAQGHAAEARAAAPPPRPAQRADAWTPAPP
ncbi:MAG: ABC transporter permease, partial [Oscillospiraceae bacterium]